jgi:hypothetical protein
MRLNKILKAMKNIFYLSITIFVLWVAYEIIFPSNPRGTMMIGINTIPKELRYQYEPINDKTIYKLPNGDYAIDEDYKGYKMILDKFGIVEYKRQITNDIN